MNFQEIRMKDNNNKPSVLAKKRGKVASKYSVFPRSNRRINSDSVGTFLDTSRWVSLVLVVFFTLIATFLCSMRQAPVAFQVKEGKIARKSITSKVNFQYKSEIDTKILQEKQRSKVYPIYKLSEAPFLKFESFVGSFFQAQMEVIEKMDELLPEELEELVFSKIKEIQKKHSLTMNYSVFDRFLKHENRKQLNRVFDEGLLVLKEIYNQGVVDNNDDGSLIMFKLSADSGDTFIKEVMSMENALRRLRLNIRVLQIEESLPEGLYEIFRRGLVTNLIYDEIATQGKIEEKLAEIEPVLIRIEEGMNIIEEGRSISPRDYERYSNYYEQLLDRSNVDEKFLNLYLERLFMVIAIFMALLVYLLVVTPEVIANNRLLSICGMSILVTLVLIRILLEFGGAALFKENPEIISILPYLSPVMLGGMIVMMMIGVVPALITAVVISSLFALIQNGSIEIFVLSMVSSFVSILFCRDIRFRGSIVRAGAMGGLTMAGLALIIGFLSHYDFIIIGWHMVASVVIGIITGVVAVGIIPVFESAFNRTTEISLLELTDFNHPLLRRLQNEAPGTYQHSMMVANLSENAAMAIGCSPLVCRVCSLFHDIGKLVKPEYFAENQRGGSNPHLDRNPSMSALVIKSHVKEGIDLARRYKLPKIMKDVIRQHHGTSLIQYFYYEALKKISGSGADLSKLNVDHNLDKVDESTYRYDGPKPQFKESAIIFFADSIEAASRSLQKVHKRSLEELLDQIVKERLEDDQLDECPLTMQEIAQIKQSFIFTLLNVYHSRIEYPKLKQEARGSKELAKVSRI